MKKIAVLFLMALIIGCNQSKKTKQPRPQTGETRIVAVYTRPDSTKVIDVLLRVISQQIVYDSTLGESVISVDTIWGRPVTVPAKDSLGRWVFDSTGKQVMTSFFMKISKDSVNWKIEGKSVDSLLKK